MAAKPVLLLVGKLPGMLEVGGAQMRVAGLDIGQAEDNHSVSLPESKSNLIGYGKGIHGAAAGNGGIAQVQCQPG